MPTWKRRIRTQTFVFGAVDPTFIPMASRCEMAPVSVYILPGGTSDSYGALRGTCKEVGRRAIYMEHRGRMKSACHF